MYMPKKKYEMHIVSHTHWDREWRLPFQEFRMKLCDCMDHLFDIMKKNPDFKHFTLDGQSIMVEDYLQARPEKRKQMAEYIKNGKILVGPWYTLIDESLLHGESIIRNPGKYWVLK